jgi:hypothetical protein
MRRAALLTVGLAVLVGDLSVAWAAGPLAAEAATLNRELAVRDKRDMLRGATAERRRCRAWLAQADKAIKEGEERRARVLLARTRAGLGLVDALMMLAEVKLERQLMTAQLKKLRASTARLQRRVKERRDHVKMLRKMK